MATLTIRNVDPEIQKRLRVRAAQNGRSMEAELRVILRDVLSQPESLEPTTNLAEAIRRRFAPYGGVDDLVPHPRVLVGDPPSLE